MPTIRLTALAALAALSVACGGGSDDPPPAAARASPYPTAADGYEGAGRDDTLATASALPVGAVQQRTLFPAGDVDFMAVYLTSGVRYEVSVNRLSSATDLYAYLYAPETLATIASNDDYYFLDPRIVYTAAESGTYRVKVTSYSSRQGQNRQNGQGAYSVSVHPYVDADGDSVSSYYDCNDANSTISPDETDVPADGIDQDCDGIDALDPSVADAFEPDGDSTHARPLPLITAGAPEEYTNRLASPAARTLTIADRDWFTFTVGAKEKLEVGARGEGDGSVWVRVYEADDLATPVLGPYDWTELTVRNDTAAPKTYFLEIAQSSGTLFYYPYSYSVGVDLDGDGYFTRDWDSSRDCDDGDAAIHPDAAETASDGVDSDCNGFD